MKFERLQSEPIYQGRAFNVRRDQVRTPAGQEVWLDIVEHVGAVTIVPLDADNRIYFVRQYRHASGQTLLELPAGTLNPGEAPEVCAAREVREEIGLAAGRLEKLGGFFLAPGYSTEYMHVFLARDLRPDPLPGDEDEFLSVESIPAAEMGRQLAAGAIQDAKSLAALMLFGLKLGG